MPNDSTSQHNQTVIDQFTQQSKTFNDYQNVFSKDTFSQKVLEMAAFKDSETVLEVAAGTCAFGRLVAPHVAHVTALDLTPAMLQVGKKEAKNHNITNMDFIEGNAEELPFTNETFSVVMSRLAFHHFPQPQQVFAEMVRVLQPGGHLLVLDLEARAPHLQTKADAIEKQRDPSHVAALSQQTFMKYAAQHQLTLTHQATTSIPVLVEDWLNLTNVQEPTRSAINQSITSDINGEEPCGLSPYLNKNGELSFDHPWMFLRFAKGL